MALAGLLKGDLVFEFGELSEKVRGEEGVIVGLFQFSEYGPSQEPMEMVSFIHKSIQEYLAAWYLIYSCVAKGNLGEIGEHAATLENCVTLENVFQFVCGLSDEGTVKVLEHLKSVRISDPALDLSKTIPDVETETDVPLCDVTYWHGRFSELIQDSFREVQSKAELLSHFLDCTGGVILVPRRRPLSELMPNVNVLTKLAQNCVFIFTQKGLPRPEWAKDSVMYKSLDFLNCLQTLPRVTDSSDVLTVEEFARKLYLENISCCSVDSILCFRNGQFQFYITELLLGCDYHARLFTESTTTSGPSNSSSSCPEQSCLKFLRSLGCNNLSNEIVKGLGAVIGNCKLDLSRIQVERCDDSICYLLEQVRNPSKCSVSIGIHEPHSTGFHFLMCSRSTHLTSVGAVRLASLLPRFNDVIALNLDLRDCSAAAQDTLVATITHETLKILILCGRSLTPAATKTLGRSLPEMSFLQSLELTDVDGSILQAEEMEALFGGFNKSMHLYKLKFSGFSMKSCLAPLIKRLPFFPNLRQFELEKLNIDEHDQCCLLKSFGFLTVTALKVCIQEKTCLDSFGYIGTYYRGNETLKLDVRSLTPAVAAVLGRLLPKMSSLQTLEFTGFDGSILQAAEMEVLFGGFNKTMPLETLAFNQFSLRGRAAAALFRSFSFFPNLTMLDLANLNMDEHDLRGLLESFQFIPGLEFLNLSGSPLGHAVTYFVAHVINLKKLRHLQINGTGLSVEDLRYLREALPELIITNFRNSSISPYSRAADRVMKYRATLKTRQKLGYAKIKHAKFNTLL